MEFQIGVGKEIPLPESAITQTFAYVGQKGGGKTYGAMKTAEQFLEHGVQTIALDPMGVWWGLTTSKDGKKPGYKIAVLGGHHADVAINPKQGADVARLVVESRISVVIDLLLMRKGERMAFATDFAEELYHLQSNDRTPMHVFLEEAHLFCPQKQNGREARMLGAFEDLVRLGRASGIGISLISQRPQSVNKNALNQAEMLLVFHMNGSHERGAIKDWITSQGTDLSLLERLPFLETGHAVIWSPSWLKILKETKIGERVTFDASSTPTLGAVKKAVKRNAEIDIRAIRDALQKTAPDEDEEELRVSHSLEPKASKRAVTTAASIKELEAQVTHLKAEIKAATPKRKTDILVSKKSLTVIEDFLAWSLGDLKDSKERLDDMLEHVGGLLGRDYAKAKEPEDEPAEVEIEQEREKPQQRVNHKARADLPGRAANMLGWIAFAESISRHRLAVLVEMTVGTGAFTSYISRLNTHGYIETDRGGSLRITKLGSERARELGLVPTTYPAVNELVDRWKRKLPGRAKEMFEYIVSTGKKGADRSEIANHVSMTNGTGAFTSYLSRIHTFGLSEQERGGRIFPATELFE